MLEEALGVAKDCYNPFLLLLVIAITSINLILAVENVKSDFVYTISNSPVNLKSLDRLAIQMTLVLSFFPSETFLVNAAMTFYSCISFINYDKQRH